MPIDGLVYCFSEFRFFMGFAHIILCMAWYDHFILYPCVILCTFVHKIEVSKNY